MNKVLGTALTLALSTYLIAQDCRAEPPKEPPASTPATKPASAAAALAVVVGTRVCLPMPAGFIAADRFTGFQNRSNGASIAVSEIPGPFDQVTAGFDTEHLKTKGMTLVSKQVAEVGGYPGVVLQVTQEGFGARWRKWLVAFGDTETVLLTATWPESLTSELQASLKEALLQVKWDRTQEVDPAAGLTYSITPSAPLKFTKRLQNMLLFTPTGDIDMRAQGNPIFIVGPSLAELDISDHSGFARKRLEQIVELQNFDITSQQPVTIDGLSGIEILASATDTRTGRPKSVYQTILFGSKVYYLMQGMVDTDLSEEFAEAFKSTARRFKLK